MGIIVSCDPSNFQLPAYQSDFFLPVLDIELSAENLLLADTTDIFQEDSTGLISLHYSLTESRTFEQILPIDDQNINFTIPGIPGSFPDFDVELPVPLIALGIEPGDYPVFPATGFEYETEVKIKEFIRAEFTSGLIGIKLTNSSPLTMQKGFLLEIINESETEPLIQLVMDQDLNSGDSFTFQNQQLAGRSLTGNFTFKMIDLMAPETNNVVIVIEDAIDVEFIFEEIELKKATFLQPEIDLPSATFDMPIFLPYGALISNLKMDAGLLVIDVPDLKNVFTIQIDMHSATRDSEPVRLIVGLNRTEADLENLEIDLSGLDGDLYNILPVTMQLVFNPELDSFDIEFDKELKGKLSVTNIDYDYVTGYLGKSDVLGEGSIDLDLFKRVRSGTLTFDVPRITTTISNGVGATAIVRDDGQGLYIRGKNDRLAPGKVIDIGSSIEGFELQPAKSLDQPQLSAFEINRDTEPQFGEFLAVLPTHIEARVPVQLGTDEILFDQFIKDDAIISVNMDLELPMRFSADRFILLDTVEFALVFDAEKFEAKSASVTANYESNFPLELIFQTIFLDENYEVIDSLFNEIKIIESAEIDDKGNVVKPLKGTFFTELKDDQLAFLRTTTYAVPVVRFNTPESKFVELKSFYTMKMKVAGEIATDVDLNP